MEAFWSMLSNVLIFVALAIPGLILVKTKVLKPEDSGVLSQLLIWVGMPFMILSCALDLELNGDVALSLLLAFAIGIAYALLYFFASEPLSQVEKNAKTRGVMRFALVFPNNGFLGLPLAAAVFGASSQVMAFLVVMNTACNMLLYTLGPYLVSGDKEKMDFKKAFLNPVLIAFIVGILLNILGVADKLPQVSDYSVHLKNVVTPVSMTILGMKLGGIQFTSLFTSWKNYFVAAIRLLLFPVVTVALVYCAHRWLGLEEAMVFAAFVSMSMPCSGSTSAFADAYGGDSESAVAFTLASTVLSVATIPILYGLLCLII